MMQDALPGLRIVSVNKPPFHENLASLLQAVCTCAQIAQPLRTRITGTL